jgi:hypothetical protein
VLSRCSDVVALGDAGTKEPGPLIVGRVGTARTLLHLRFDVGVQELAQRAPLGRWGSSRAASLMAVKASFLVGKYRSRRQVASQMRMRNRVPPRSE